MVIISTYRNSHSEGPYVWHHSMPLGISIVQKLYSHPSNSSSKSPGCADGPCWWRRCDCSRYSKITYQRLEWVWYQYIILRINQKVSTRALNTILTCTHGFDIRMYKTSMMKVVNSFGYPSYLHLLSALAIWIDDWTQTIGNISYFGLHLTKLKAVPLSIHSDMSDG